MLINLVCFNISIYLYISNCLFICLFMSAHYSNTFNFYYLYHYQLMQANIHSLIYNLYFCNAFQLFLFCLS
nr:MAG TPA: hypothetical protein [Bacteriophage sp.]